ncbi:MAG: hypothetical protein R2755_23750 [Acidimicrobiales bacterium]
MSSASSTGPIMRAHTRAPWDSAVQGRGTLPASAAQQVQLAGSSAFRRWSEGIAPTGSRRRFGRIVLGDVRTLDAQIGKAQQIEHPTRRPGREQTLQQFPILPGRRVRQIGQHVQLPGEPAVHRLELLLVVLGRG